jgi:hypothetical protein
VRRIRGLPVLAAATAALILPAVAVQTGRATLPITTVGYHTVVVTGAPLLSVTHTTTGAGSTITGSTIVLVGNYKHSTVTEQFTGGPQRTCSFESKSKGETEFSCNGFNQATNISSSLAITVD